MPVSFQVTKPFTVPSSVQCKTMSAPTLQTRTSLRIQTSNLNTIASTGTQKRSNASSPPTTDPQSICLGSTTLAVPSISVSAPEEVLEPFLGSERPTSYGCDQPIRCLLTNARRTARTTIGVTRSNTSHKTTTAIFTNPMERLTNPHEMVWIENRQHRDTVTSTWNVRSSAASYNRTWI